MQQDDTRRLADLNSEGDAAILRKFRVLLAHNDKLAAMAGTAPDDDPGYEAMCDAQSQMEKDIAVTPASGYIGMAIKAYLLRQLEGAPPNDNYNGIRHPGRVEDAPGIDGKFRVAIILDALRVLPALDALRLHGSAAFNAAMPAIEDEFRTSLMRSTSIPSLGMTFAQAARRFAQALEEFEQVPENSPENTERRQALSDEWSRIHKAVAEAILATPGDCCAALAVVLNPCIGIPASDAHELSIRIARNVRDFLSAMPAGMVAAEQPLETSIVEPLGMTFRQAADRVREIMDWNDASWERDESNEGKEEQQRRANDEERHRIVKAIFEAPAKTIGDVLVKLERLACPIFEAGAFETDPEDINAIAVDLRRIGAASPISWQSQHPDAELIDTTGQWFAMVDGFNGMEGDPTPEQMAEADRLHSGIVALPACTAAGVLAKAAALTSRMVGCVAGLEEGDQLYPLLRSMATTEEAEPVAQLARRLVGHLQEIDRDSLHAETAITALRTDPPQRSDFAAAIGAFKGAAPAGLCMPDSPTGAMLEAGASVGGINPDQARAIYVAMADAYRLEAVA